MHKVSVTFLYTLSSGIVKLHKIISTFLYKTEKIFVVGNSTFCTKVIHIVENFCADCTKKIPALPTDFGNFV